ncbi:hypothetical protein [Paenibacillus sp. GCM10012306]|uniref:hypothetical protein n=1 Tax=Paenibacillus sp. GCM10012306 TaxID=3317342 RepID=UPI00361A6BA7
MLFQSELSADGVLITVITLSETDARLLNEPDTNKLMEEINQLVHSNSSRRP